MKKCPENNKDREKKDKNLKMEKDPDFDFKEVGSNWLIFDPMIGGQSPGYLPPEVSAMASDLAAEIADVAANPSDAEQSQFGSGGGDETPKMAKAQDDANFHGRVEVLEEKMECPACTVEIVLATMKTQDHVSTRDIVTSSEFARIVFDAFAKAGNSEYGVSVLFLRKLLQAHHGLDLTTRYNRRRLSNFLKKQVQDGKISVDGELYRLN